MKLIILQENLHQALVQAERFVDSKPQLPVLANVLLSCKEGAFFVSSTNLETGIKLRVGAKIEKEGAITVPAKLLSEVVGSLSPGKINLETEKESLMVSSGGFRSTLQGIAASEFPPFPEKTKGAGTKIEKDLLTEVVDKVGFAASTDESRPVLTGILLSPGTKTSLVATDGYRLSVLTLKGDKSLGLKGQEDNLLIPSGVLREAQRSFANLEEGSVEIEWAKEKKQMFLTLGDNELVTKLLEGDFPDYKAILPKENTLETLINKEDLLQAVKLSAVFARESANIIRWKIDNGKLVVSANSPQVGENQTTLEIEIIEGSSGEIAFNSRYLIDILTRLKGERVRFKMSEALKPGVFEEEKGESDFVHIIMPVRVQGEE